MTMADRIAVMAEGRIQQVGTPVEIYKRPASRFVADFIGESNFIERRALPPELGGDDKAGVVMVRPESILVSDGDEAPQHALTGVLRQTAFLGSYTRVALHCPASAEPVTAAVQGRNGHLGALEPGARLALWWRREDAVALDEEGPAPTTEEEDPT